MALKLNETYPGRFNNPTADYPQGSFKNRTTPTAQDGSYFEQQWANDHLAFFSSLLSGAGVTANGAVDKVGASQYYNSLLTVIQSQLQIPSYLAKSGIPGAYANLKCSATGTNAQVTITADAVCVKNSANEQVVLNSVSVTPSLSASGANGLDTSTSTASTCYYLWIIWNGTTAAGLFSLSNTSPVMPSGYTHKALVGAVYSDSTANKYPLSFKQDGNLCRYKVASGSNVTAYPVIASGIAGSVSTPTYVSVSLSGVVPPNARAVIFVMSHIAADTSLNAIVSATNQTGPLHSATNPPEWSFTNSSSGGTAIYPIRIQLETFALFWANNSGNSKLRIVGWEF